LALRTSIRALLDSQSAPKVEGPRESTSEPGMKDLRRLSLESIASGGSELAFRTLLESKENALKLPSMLPSMFSIKRIICAKMHPSSLLSLILTDASNPSSHRDMNYVTRESIFLHSVDVQLAAQKKETNEQLWGRYFLRKKERMKRVERSKMSYGELIRRRRAGMHVVLSGEFSANSKSTSTSPTNSERSPRSPDLSRSNTFTSSPRERKKSFQSQRGRSFSISIPVSMSERPSVIKPRADSQRTKSHSFAVSDPASLLLIQKRKISRQTTGVSQTDKSFDSLNNRMREMAAQAQAELQHTRRGKVKDENDPRATVVPCIPE